MENKELAHHGILGMKWGRRRYQNKDGSLTQEGLKRYREQDPEGYEKLKQEAIKKGSAAEVMKFKGELSNKELQDAFTRLNLERNIADISAKSVESANAKIKSLSETLGTMKDIANKGIDAWNIFAKINNAFSTNELPTIDGKSLVDKKKEEREKAEKERIEKHISTVSLADAKANIAAGKYTSEELKRLYARFTAEKNLKNFTF